MPWQTTIPTPDNHFAAGPDCGMTRSGGGRVRGARGGPTVRAGIVSPARVQKSGAHRHPRPRRSFHCRSRLRCATVARGRVHNALLVWVFFLGIIYPGRSLERRETVLLWPPDGCIVAITCRWLAISYIRLSLTKRSTRTGLARHSAMTYGSFPALAKSSRRHLGCCLACCHAIDLSLQLLGTIGRFQ